MRTKLTILLTALAIIATACSSADSTEQTVWNTDRSTDQNRTAEPKVDETWTVDDEADLSVTTEAMSEQAGSETTVATGESTITEARRAAEPEEVYDTIEFREYGVNPRVDAREDNLSTFAMDVDTGSYAIARRFISDGVLPSPDTVRVEEYVNALDYHYPGPDEGFAIHLMAGESPFADRDRTFLQVGLQAARVDAADRPPANLTFVIDVSGSMDREDRLETVKDALGILVDELRPSDQVGIVVYGTYAEVILEPTAVEDAELIMRAIDRLEPSGSTNAEAGLELGYRLANDAYSSRAINRVILASDGVANVGATTADGILRTIEDHARRGIHLVTVGFGMGNYNDVLMEQLADQGDGFYAYVDTLDEAERIFNEELTGTLLTVAKDAKVQVSFNPSVVEEYRLVGYENRDIADEDFRNDRVDAGEVGAGHSVTAIYELALDPDARSNEQIASVSLRWLDPESDRVVEISETIDVGDVADRFEDTPNAFQVGTTVAALGELLKDTRYADHIDWRDLVEIADDLARQFDDDHVDEFADLVYDASRLAR